MPIAGFRRGDKVLTPSGKSATVRSTARIGGRERVFVVLDTSYGDEKAFDAAALRLQARPQ